SPASDTHFSWGPLAWPFVGGTTRRVAVEPANRLLFQSARAGEIETALVGSGRPRGPYRWGLVALGTRLRSWSAIHNPRSRIQSLSRGLGPCFALSLPCASASRGADGGDTDLARQRRYQRRSLPGLYLDGGSGCLIVLSVDRNHARRLGRLSVQLPLCPTRSALGTDSRNVLLRYAVHGGPGGSSHEQPVSNCPRRPAPRSEYFLFQGRADGGPGSGHDDRNHRLSGAWNGAGGRSKQPGRTGGQLSGLRLYLATSPDTAKNY